MTLPGPGDPQTWGPPTGHANDPRTPDPVDCPGCDGLAGPNGCAEEEDCGWRWPEPDYEAMIEDRAYGGRWR